MPNPSMKFLLALVNEYKFLPKLTEIAEAFPGTVVHDLLENKYFDMV